MTAVENLLIAQHRHLNTNFFAGLFKTPAFRKSEREAMEYAAVLAGQGQPDRVCQPPPPAPWLTASNVAWKSLAAMMTRPADPDARRTAAGLNPKETEDLKALITVLREENNATVLLIEHDMNWS